MPAITIDLGKLDDEISELETRLDELNAVRRWVSRQAESLPVADSLAPQIAARISRVADDQPEPVRREGFFALKAHDAAQQVILDLGSPMTLADIAEELTERGYGSHFANLKNAVSTALTRHTEMFVRFVDGTWGLMSEPVHRESAAEL